MKSEKWIEKKEGMVGEQPDYQPLELHVGALLPYHQKYVVVVVVMY